MAHGSDDVERGGRHGRRPLDRHAHANDVAFDDQRSIFAAGSRLALVSAAGFMLAIVHPGQAGAHGIAGDRLFPATLSFDDPAVADEFGAVASRQKHPVPLNGRVLDTSIAASLTRLLRPRLAVSADGVWTEHDRSDASAVTGFGPTHLALKGLLLESDAHETLVSVGLSWGIGGLGNRDLHTTPYSTLTPGLFFGRGLGDLPAALSWLRPFALAGGLAVELPTSGRSSPSRGAAPIGNPTIVHTAIALEYSTLYLTDRFATRAPGQEPLNQLVPLVEFQFDSSLDGGYGRKTAATMAPGLTYVFETYQLSVEAIVPLNHLAGSSTGFRIAAVFFLDDLLPALFAKPIFGN